MARKARVKGVKARAIRITPLGYRILRAVERGKYRFAPSIGTGRKRKVKSAG